MSASSPKKPVSTAHKVGDVTNKVENATKGLDSSLGSVTTTIEKNLKSLPKFPEGVATWLGKYLWIVVAVVSVLGVIGGLSSLLTLDRQLNPWKFYSNNELGGFLSSVLVNIRFTPIQQAAIVIGILGSLAQSIIGVLAIMPLKENKLFGWKLLYWSTLLGFAVNMISGLLNLSPVSVVFTVIFGVFALWIVFGIKSQFSKK